MEAALDKEGEQKKPEATSVIRKLQTGLTFYAVPFPFIILFLKCPKMKNTLYMYSDALWCASIKSNILLWQ